MTGRPSAPGKRPCGVSRTCTRTRSRLGHDVPVAVDHARRGTPGGARLGEVARAAVVVVLDLVPLRAVDRREVVALVVDLALLDDGEVEPDRPAVRRHRRVVLLRYRE